MELGWMGRKFWGFWFVPACMETGSGTGSGENYYCVDTNLGCGSFREIRCVIVV